MIEKCINEHFHVDRKNENVDTMKNRLKMLKLSINIKVVKVTKFYPYVEKDHFSFSVYIAAE